VPPTIPFSPQPCGAPVGVCFSVPPSLCLPLLSSSLSLCVCVWTGMVVVCTRTCVWAVLPLHGAGADAGGGGGVGGALSWGLNCKMAACRADRVIDVSVRACGS
jgi:hypothetical protein